MLLAQARSPQLHFAISPGRLEQHWGDRARTAVETAEVPYGTRICKIGKSLQNGEFSPKQTAPRGEEEESGLGLASSVLHLPRLRKDTDFGSTVLLEGAGDVVSWL